MCYKETHCGYSSGRAECDFRAHAIYTIFAVGEKAFFPSSLFAISACGSHLFASWHGSPSSLPFHQLASQSREATTGQAGRLRRHRSASPPFPAALVMMGGVGGGPGLVWRQGTRDTRGGGAGNAHILHARIGVKKNFFFHANA